MPTGVPLSSFKLSGDPERNQSFWEMAENIDTSEKAYKQKENSIDNNQTILSNVNVKKLKKFEFTQDI